MKRAQENIDNYPILWILHYPTSVVISELLINLHGQRILISNRNITVISQFRGGCIRAYVDIQLLKNSCPEYAFWMITVTYKVE